MTPPLSLFHHIVNCAAAFHDAHEIIIVQLSSLIILLDLEWRHLTLKINYENENIFIGIYLKIDKIYDLFYYKNS